MTDIEKIRLLSQALDAAIRWIDHLYSKPIKDDKEFRKINDDNTIGDSYKADMSLIRRAKELKIN